MIASHRSKVTFYEADSRNDHNWHVWYRFGKISTWGLDRYYSRKGSVGPGPLRDSRHVSK